MRRTFPKTNAFLLFLQLGGDYIFCFAALCLTYYLRFHTFLADFLVQVPLQRFQDYLPLIALGSLFFTGTYAYLNLYDRRLLLRPLRVSILILKGTTFWFFAFLGTSLALRFEPEISRAYVALGWIVTMTVMVGWRYLLFLFLQRSEFFRDRLIQRVIIIGWNEEAFALAEAINKDSRHPYEVLGILESSPEAREARSDRSRLFQSLGTIDDLEDIVWGRYVDIVVLADVHIPRSQQLDLAHRCERLYVDFKIIPSYFQIFISNLHLQTISGIPLMGIEEPICNQPFNQILKRGVDIVGALVGLFLSAPIILIVGWLIRKEDGGVVFFSQERIGKDFKPFSMYKLRSMKMGAEKMDHLNQSTLRHDPRLLKVGQFIRRWNIDELPQFWNVLKGDMSLVGPRPERTYYVNNLTQEILHYSSRHMVKPGMTGWAQVNGLRGDTSLEERIKFDLYYIENWNLWLDLQILVMTFLKRENAY